MKRQKKILMMVLIILSLLLATSSYAQVAVKKGYQIPEDGIYYTIDEHARLVAKIKGQQDRCKIEKEYLTKKLELKHNLDISRLKIDNETLNKQLNLQKSLYDDNKKYLLKELQKAKNTPWYKSVSFLYITGFLSATLVYSLTIYAYNKLK